MHHNQTKNITFDAKLSLLEALRKNKFPIPFSCGGEGICTTCRIILKSGELTPPTQLEQERQKERNFNREERLSCQCYGVSGPLSIIIP